MQCPLGPSRVPNKFKTKTSAKIAGHANDNDNDTLREVPHWSDEGLALQARASGPWPHEKRICLTGEACSVGKVQEQTVMDRV